MHKVIITYNKSYPWKSPKLFKVITLNGNKPLKSLEYMDSLARGLNLLCGSQLIHFIFQQLSKKSPPRIHMNGNFTLSNGKKIFFKNHVLSTPNSRLYFKPESTHCLWAT